MNPVHGVPKDFWRFTPEALELLHKQFSEVIAVGGWGNFKALWLMRKGLRFTGVPSASWHPLHRVAVKNESDWPVTVWIAARK